jgi:hypothetical protein
MVPGYLLVKKPIAFISKILMKKQLPRGVEQQDSQQKYSDRLFQQ